MLDCEDCKLYWQNNDTGVECNGNSTPCDEFIDDRAGINEPYYALDLLINKIENNLL